MKRTPLKRGTKALKRSPFKKPLPAGQDAKKLLGRAFGAKRKDSRSKAMKDADKWFSQFIRLRDADENGLVKCITCPRVAHWTEMDAGHYASRAKQSTRYDEKNVNAQCGGCNRWQGGKFIEHAIAIDRKHPKEIGSTSSELAYKAMQECKRTLSDFRFLASVYKERVENIRANSPGKFNKAA